ncbi:MAG: DNA polymerase IV, partial [Clostridiales bacterium]
MAKVVCHIDVNSAFLSWTAVYRLRVLGEQVDLRQIPAVVCGDQDSRHSIVLAKSMPAKAYGIKTGEPLFQALRKCPSLTVAGSDYPLYVESSRKFMEILKQIAPVVEQFSIDEAWIDLSGTEKLYGPPIHTAEQIKNRIRDELGFTVNIGVSCNKLLAKMAGDFQKPDRVHTLFPHEIETKLWPLPVRDLFFVGPATEQKLHQMGIATIGQLAQTDVRYLKARLHKQGQVIWNFANGICPDEVSDAVVLNKGYGNSVTTPTDITDRRAACKILLSLSETVGMRMRRDQQLTSCVTVRLRTNQFNDISRQMQLSHATCLTAEIYQAACLLLQQMWQENIPLRQLGVSVGKI